MDASEAAGTLRMMVESISRVVVGARDIVEMVVAAVAAGGHVLLEGPPGTGKTLLAKALSMSIQGEFKRVQGNPDLLPTDLTGYYIYSLDGGRRFVRGPVFANILLFDELNRTPTRVQSALLQAMAEYQVSIDGVIHSLPRPFHVVATEVPAEEEAGVFPLARTLLDRFWVKAVTRIVDPSSEEVIVSRGDVYYSLDRVSVDPVTDVAGFTSLQSFIDYGVHVSRRVVRYIVSIAGALRGSPLVEWGPSHRGPVHLYRVSKALALLDGRDYVVPDDVKRAAVPVLAHRVKPSRAAEARGMTAEDVVLELLGEVEVPKE